MNFEQGEELGTALGDQFTETALDALKDAPTPTNNESVNRAIDAETVKDRQTARRQRQVVVIFTLYAVAGLLLAATVCMGVYMGSQWHQVDSKVVIAYFASVIVETIGVLYVITRNLFPQPEKDTKKT